MTNIVSPNGCAAMFLKNDKTVFYRYVFKAVIYNSYKDEVELLVSTIEQAF